MPTSQQQGGKTTHFKQDGLIDILDNNYSNQFISIKPTMQHGMHDLERRVAKLLNTSFIVDIQQDLFMT